MEKPEIDFVDPEPPTDLVITDLTEGDGPEAASGNTVEVHYVGVAHSTGEEFDASYNRGEPLKFRLGVGQVIQGWDTGVQGMKVGGRRQLVIPPHLGYGDRGAGGVIKPGETLVFVVDLLERQLSGPSLRCDGHSHSRSPPTRAGWRPRSPRRRARAGGRAGSRPRR